MPRKTKDPEYYRKYHERHRERRWDQFLRRAYGIGLDDYRAMALAQAGRCAICGRKPRLDRKLHVDHDHVTGRVRKLLCPDCNAVLGYAGDDPQVLGEAIKYLAEHASA